MFCMLPEQLSSGVEDMKLKFQDMENGNALLSFVVILPLIFLMSFGLTDAGYKQISNAKVNFILHDSFNAELGISDRHAPTTYDSYGYQIQDTKYQEQVLSRIVRQAYQKILQSGHVNKDYHHTIYVTAGIISLNVDTTQGRITGYKFLEDSISYGNPDFDQMSNVDAYLKSAIEKEVQSTGSSEFAIPRFSIVNNNSKERYHSKSNLVFLGASFRTKNLFEYQVAKRKPYVISYRFLVPRRTIR